MSATLLRAADGESPVGRLPVAFRYSALSEEEGLSFASALAASGVVTGYMHGEVGEDEDEAYWEDGEEGEEEDDEDEDEGEEDEDEGEEASSS